MSEDPLVRVSKPWSAMDTERSRLTTVDVLVEIPSTMVLVSVSIATMYQ
jgi:hypothetical protein